MRRTISHLIVFVLLGAMTTVAIAWGFAIATNRAPKYVTFTGPTGLVSINPPNREKVYFAEGEWHSVLRTATTGGDIVRLDCLAGDPVYDPHISPRDLPRWTLAHRRPRAAYDAITMDRSLHEEAWGWPLRAVYSRTWLGVQREVASSDGQIIRDELITVGGLIRERDLRVLPFVPLWTGLIVNSVAFALMWWLLFLLVSQLRQRLRIPHGHCPRCAYDLRGDLRTGCPECGWNRAASAGPAEPI